MTVAHESVPEIPLDQAARTFIHAATMFSGWVADLDTDASSSDGPSALSSTALGEWTTRDLIGHTLRAVLTVETYLGQLGEEATLHTPAAYFHAGRAIGSAAEVAERGRQAGADLGDDVAGAVAEAIDRVIALVDDQVDEGSDPVVTTRMGAIRLSTYLPTRTFELVVHSLDLAKATGVRLEVPVDAMRDTLHLLADLALLDGQGAQVAFALTGRGGLGDDFTLLG